MVKCPAMRPFQHVALVGKYQADGIGPLLADIARWLARRGLDVALEKQTAQLTGLAHFEALDEAQIGRECDLAVVVGGDGTMLGIARRLAPFDVPMVGINHGRLGFITDIPLASWTEGLQQIIDGDYVEDRRAMLAGDVWRDGGSVFSAESLNDVVVSRGATSAMVELRVDLGDEFVLNVRADGLIVSTPTGSTAYALSANGPILHPDIGGWVVVPVASHTLTNRPIVLPDREEIRITVVAGRDASASFDSQGVASVLHGDQVRVRRSSHQVRFLHPMGWSYYTTLRRKLRWYVG